MNPMTTFIQDLAVPVLPAIKVGRTGYLDQLRPGEMNAPVMKGTDPFGRPFLALKLHLDITFDDGLDDPVHDVQAVCLFQRYENNDRVWAIGTHGGTFSAELVGREAGHVDPLKIQELLSGKELEFSRFGETQKLRLVK